MSLAVGSALGLGVVLMLSPWLWPVGEGRRSNSSRLLAGLRTRLAQAGLHSVTIPVLAAVSLIVAVTAAALTFALIQVVALAIAAGVAAFLAPVLEVGRRARRRRRATRTLWPDAVDHLVSAVRSGLALPDGIVLLARTGPEATRQDFAVFERDYRATGNFALSLDLVKARLADPVADRILETLRMSREVGGSELTAVLRNLAAYLRQEAGIRAEVEARQSWVINAARLGVAAPWIVLLLLSTRPEAAAAYNTVAGVTVIIAGLVVSVVAYRLMLSLGRLPEERRWFR